MKSLKIQEPGTFTRHTDFEGEPLRVGNEVVFICYSELARGIIVRGTPTTLIVLHYDFFGKNRFDFKNNPPSKWPDPHNDRYDFRTISDFGRIKLSNTYNSVARAWIDEIYYNRSGWKAKQPTTQACTK